ncbi:hypothetical protein AB0M20_31615, partial [Actinoplanes sp. NPDC051633]|uniref:hypothetical protein n=1 Tax=Actinoplanes sp. NPDC051633 TaxID=3155670 RepID=UPI00341C90C1
RRRVLSLLKKLFGLDDRPERPADADVDVVPVARSDTRIFGVEDDGAWPVHLVRVLPPRDIQLREEP